MSTPLPENAPLITMHRIDADTIHLPLEQTGNTLRASSNIMDGNISDRCFVNKFIVLLLRALFQYRPIDCLVRKAFQVTGKE